MCNNTDIATTPVLGRADSQFAASQQNIRLNVQQVDVESAIEKTLGSIPFFKQILDRVEAQWNSYAK